MTSYSQIVASMPRVRLYLTIGGATRLALSIPLAECTNYAVNPLKWVLFLGYAIYGQEGYLSKSKNGRDIGDYTAVIESRSYYFISPRKLNYLTLKSFKLLMLQSPQMNLALLISMLLTTEHPTRSRRN